MTGSLIPKINLTIHPFLVSNGIGFWKANGHATAGHELRGEVLIKGSRGFRLEGLLRPLCE
jgi:hypothetical protein